MLDHFFGAGQLFQLARLRKIAKNQLQVLGLFERLIRCEKPDTVGDNIACQRGKKVVGIEIAGKAAMRAERAQRTGHVDNLPGSVSALFQTGGFGKSRPPAP